MGNSGLSEIENHEHIDELTGFLKLNGILSHIQSYGQEDEKAGVVIIYLNVMNFKTFNKRYGFAGGNEFLKGLAAEIRSIFPDELVARTGGDHFIIYGRSLEEKEILDRLSKLREASVKHEKALPMRIKAGIYLASGNEEDPVVSVDRAKIACDDIIRVYDKYDNFYNDELDKKNELRQYVIDNFESAFQKRYFKVYYQKEVRAMTGKVCGYEALARWQDPVMGLISPAIFVEVLESVHLVHKLDTYIIYQVCSDLRDDIDSGYSVEPISVNLSQLDFELCDILTEVDKCRETFDIPKSLLHIEITESAIAFGADFLGDEIRRFREAGYEVWMDDFGAGYSSLNNLKNYDFDVLKIDMNFLRSFENNKRSHVILAAIVNMAKELGIHTLAEGVETKEQYEFLKNIGCEKLQGYLFGKPKPVDDFDREAELTPEFCEDYTYSYYYEAIGEINLLGNTPLRAKEMIVKNNIPIAITELLGTIPQILYANDAYLSVISSLGFSSLEEINAFYALHSDLPELDKFVHAVRQAEESPDHRIRINTISNGSIVDNKIRFLSRHGDTAVFAIVTRNTSLNNQADLSEDLQVAMAHVFNQYFRVDLFDDYGKVDNIYLNANQRSVADVENDAVKAVSYYAELYLFPEDRERFKNLYYIPTVRERVRESGGDYLVEYFRSGMPEDNGRMQMYMILPFYYNGKWKYISCCRYADELKDDYLK
ncbi:MAG: GGDEF domain-containing phosphodiesterase [Butyrivibrio sp.]|nr:GGDEF domain-containing phosphodiesterase [Butyrivibrio sp.]